MNTDEGDFYGTSTSLIDNIVFRNLKIGGNCITSLAQGNMDKNSYATNVLFLQDAEMNITEGMSNIADNTGTSNFGNVEKGSTKTITYTIENKSCGGVLNLTSTPRVTVTGTGFSIVSDAAASVAAGGTTTFQVIFSPNAATTFNGTVSIANNDTDENPYNFTISGIGTTTINGINLVGNSNDFKVFPTLGGVKIQVNSKAAYQVVDMLGQVVASGICMEGLIFIQSKPRGVYFVRVNSKGFKVFVNN